MAHDHVGHIAQPNRGVSSKLNDRARQILGFEHRRQMTDGQSLCRCVDKPAGSEYGRIAGSSYHGIKRYIVCPKPVRIDHYLELPVALPPDRHIGYAWNGHESWRKVVAA
jgi:hypothetical protein